MHVLSYTKSLSLIWKIGKCSFNSKVRENIEKIRSRTQRRTEEDLSVNRSNSNAEYLLSHSVNITEKIDSDLEDITDSDSEAIKTANSNPSLFPFDTQD